MASGQSYDVIGSALTHFLPSSASADLMFSLMYGRYFGVLAAGGGRKGYPTRNAYDHLRESLFGACADHPVFGSTL
jgi:hypothetical protein